MTQMSRGVAHSSLSTLATAGLAVLLVVVSLAATACGTDADSSATMTTTDAGSTTTTGDRVERDGNGSGHRDNDHVDSPRFGASSCVWHHVGAGS